MGAVHAFAFVRAAWIRLRLYGGRDQSLSESLLLCQPSSTSLTLMSWRLFRIDVTETDLIGGKGIHVLHQFDPLVLQVFQRLVH